jgi:hypothetical protein
MDVIVKLIFVVIAVAITFGFIARVMPDLEDGKRVGMNDNAIESLKRGCDTACTTMSFSEGIENIMLGSGTKLYSNNTKICYLMDSNVSGCTTCACELDDRMILDTTGSAMEEELGIRAYQCRIGKEDGNVTISCES